ncbi:MAG: DNA primase [Akkermansiaceae bacterium]
MAMIPEETIKAVLDSTDIVDVIGSYFPLKRAGSAFVCNCPFHNEKTPSFNVNPAKQYYHCFGCGVGGDAIKFVKEYENIPFTDAVKKLADRAGVPIIEAAFDPQQEKRQRSRSRLIQLHNEAALFMHKMLRKSPQAAHARDYLKNRGFNAEMAERWTIGWMPDNSALFLHWARENGYTGRELCQAGLAGQRDENNPKAGLWVRFGNRLMFPIHNDYGDIIAFSGRQLIEDKNSGKYINSPQTQIFDKSRTLFGLDKARRHMTKAKFALICEGQIDAIVCYEKGIQNAIAPLGTACTEHHARLLKRYTSEAVLCYDADNAGYKAMGKAFDHLAPAGIHIRCIDMPKGEDPDSYIQKHGVKAFQNLVENAKEYFDFKLDQESRETNLTDIREKTRLTNELAARINLLSNKIAQDTVINQVAARLGVGSQDLRQSMKKASLDQARQQKYENSKDQNLNHHGEPAEQPTEPTPLDSSVSVLCSLCLSSNTAQELLREQLESLHTPLQNTTGGHLLTTILSRKPDATSNGAIMAFLSTLHPADTLALQQTLSYRTPDDIERATMDTTNMIINSHYQREETAVRAALSQPGLSPEQIAHLMQRTKELQDILKNLTNRYIR